MQIQCLSAKLAAVAVSFAVLTMGNAEAATASVSYSYDLLGRINAARYDNGVCVVYAYDPVGNRTSQLNTTESPIWGTGVWDCFVWSVQHVQMSRPQEYKQAQVSSGTTRSSGR